MEEKKIHTFEEAGLGKAPFKYIGMEERRASGGKLGIQIGYTGQPIGCCAYCGKGIAICCIIEDAEGKRFIVGSTCVNKTGDKGLKKKVKQAVNERKIKRERKRIEAAIADWNANKEKQDIAKARAHSNPYFATQGKTLCDEINFFISNAGHTGKLNIARVIEGL